MAPRGRSTTLAIDLVANDKGASKVLARQRKEADGLADAAKGVNAELQKAAQLAGGGFAAYKGFEILKGSAERAAGFNEAANTSVQIFREANAEVAEFADGAADAYGQSKRLALESTTAFGNLLNNTGFARAESAQWSITLAKLASDLAAFKNVSPEEALTALQSGLAGETEPMRRFGVDLTQRTLEVDALSLGLDTNITKLDRRQRAEVVLASIMRQTSDVQGQFNREIEGYNQQQAIATAKSENAKASFGDGLLPIFTKLAQAQGAIADGFEALPGPLQAITSTAAAGGLAVGGLAVAVGLLGPALVTGKAALLGLAAAGRTAAINLVVPTAATTGLGTAQTATTAKTVGLTAALRAQVGTLGVLKTGLIAAAAGFTSYAVAGHALENLAKSDASPSKLADDMIRLSDGSITADKAVADIGGSVESLAKKFKIAYGNSDLWDRLTPKGEGAIEIRRAQSDIEALDAALAGLVDAGKVDQAKAAFRQIAAGLIEQGVATEDVAAFMDQYFDALDHAEVQQGEAAKSTDGLTGALEGELTMLERIAKARDEDRRKMEAEWSAKERMRDATEEVATARTEEAEAMRAAAGDSDEYRDATAAVADAQEALADSHQGVADAQQRVNEAREAAADKLEELRRKVDELRESEERANLTTRQAQQAARDALADPTLTGLEKEDAQLKAREAAQDERDLKVERADAAREYAEAQRRGIDGDRDVVEAKRGVADAEDRVREAAQGVTDAQKRQAQVITDAKARVVEATERVEEALKGEVEAWAGLAEAQWGAAAGTVAYQQGLDALLERVKPGSPLAESLRRMRDDLHAMSWEALQGVGGGLGLAAGWQAGTSTAPGVTINQYGTPEQVRRATTDTLWGMFDGAARRAG